MLRIGLIVSILVLAVDPFAQQLLQFEQRVTYTETENGTVNTVPRAERYSRGTEYSDRSILLLCVSPAIHNRQAIFANADFSMQSAILYGLSQPKTNVMKQLQFNCPSGNCTWASFESLAVCSKCNDLTSSLERFHDAGDLYSSLVADHRLAVAELNSTGFRTSNNLWIDNLNGSRYDVGGNTDYSSRIPGMVLMTAYGTGNTSQTSSMKKLDTLIWSTSIIRVLAPDNHLTAWPDLPLEATECALYYCINNYTTRVQDGILSEISSQLTATRHPQSWVPMNLDSQVLPEPYLSNLEFDDNLSGIVRSDLQLVSPNSHATYNVSQTAVDSISSFFQSTFTDPARTNTSRGSYSGRLNAFLVNQTGLQYAPAMAQVLWNADDLPATFEAVAASMSNALRLGDAGGLLQVGQGGRLRTFYRVQWGWIVLPAGVALAGGVFLALTMLRSQARTVWKSSTLALLSRRLMVGLALEGAETLSEMEALAKKAEETLFAEEAQEVTEPEDLDQEVDMESQRPRP
ncbi:hypothetical protein B0T10DRAFT_513043 [Thelonectria olida]|uniref:Uncharacterized protein n=1 Tax=Thelonectria olida TaxID=1576542 RepID=A0A9P8W498_9HYPO|nr:hypothetical protein B0T10DRAFT_513043 [Thelonectria olida]